MQEHARFGNVFYLKVSTDISSNNELIFQGSLKFQWYGYLKARRSVICLGGGGGGNLHMSWIRGCAIILGTFLGGCSRISYVCSASRF